MLKEEVEARAAAIVPSSGGYFRGMIHNDMEVLGLWPGVDKWSD